MSYGPYTLVLELGSSRISSGEQKDDIHIAKQGAATDGVAPSVSFIVRTLQKSEEGSMNRPSLSYAELEALHDVLEAARCYWHGNPAVHLRAAETLRLANRLYWRLGEELPKNGTPSERFRPVKHSSHGGTVDEFVEIVINLTCEYTNVHDPWWADTIAAHSNITALLSTEELQTFIKSLQRLGLTFEMRDDVPLGQIIAERRDWGPWIEDIEGRK